MRIGPLVTLLSTTYGLPEASVTLVARAMREAGWISTGARGVNAPEMNTRDVARLTLALLSGEPASKVVAEFEILRSLQTKTVFSKEGFVPQSALPQAHTFEDLITALFTASFDGAHVGRFIDPFPGGYLWPRFSIAVDASRRSGQVDLPNLRADYEDLAGAKELDTLYAIRPLNLEIHIKIQEIEDRTASEGSSRVVANRGMRVIRSICQEELKTIAMAMGTPVVEGIS